MSLSYSLWVDRIGGVFVHSFTPYLHNTSHRMGIQTLVNFTSYYPYIINTTGVTDPKTSCIFSRYNPIIFSDKYYEDT